MNAKSIKGSTATEEIITELKCSLTDGFGPTLAIFYYTYGEYGKGLNVKHEFHSITSSWVAFKEK